MLTLRVPCPYDAIHDSANRVYGGSISGERVFDDPCSDRHGEAGVPRTARHSRCADRGWDRARHGFNPADSSLLVTLAHIDLGGL